MSHDLQYVMTEKTALMEVMNLGVVSSLFVIHLLALQ